MSRTKTDASRGVGKRERARQLVTEALRAQQAGDDATADRLFDEASQLDPDAVAEVLRVTGADTAADARDAPTGRTMKGR